MFHVEPKAPKRVIASTKDFLVSGKRFDILYDPNTQIAATDPQPPEAELNQYYASEAYISHGNKRASLVDQLYAMVQAVMLQQKKRWLSRYTSGEKTYWDIGCGTGTLVHYLSKRGWEAHGVEPSAKARKASAVPEKLVASISDLPKKKVDTIALWHVFEHLPHPEKALKEYTQHLTNEGRLFIAVPNLNSFDASYYRDFWAAYDVPRHLWHFSSEGIIKLCEQNGFEFIASKGMLFDAFYVSYLSEKHQNSKAALLRGILVGLWSNAKALFNREYSSKVYVFKKNA